MEIEIEGIKKKKGKSTGNIDLNKLGFDYPDGRRKFGDEISKAFIGESPSKTLAKLSSEDPEKNENLRMIIDGSSDILKDGLDYYFDLVLPKIWRTEEEVGFVYFVARTISERMGETISRNEPGAMDFARLLEKLYKFSIKPTEIHARRGGRPDDDE